MTGCSASTPRPACRVVVKPAARALRRDACRPRAPRTSRAPRRCSRTWRSTRSTLEDALRLLTLPAGRRHRPRTASRSPPRTAGTGPTSSKGTESRSLDSEEQLFTVTCTRRAGPARPAQGRAAGRPAAPAAARARHRPRLRASRWWSRRAVSAPYVTDGETNASLRKGDSVEEITDERALRAAGRAPGPRAGRRRRPAGRRPRRRRQDRRQEDRRQEDRARRRPPRRPPPRRPPAQEGPCRPPRSRVDHGLAAARFASDRRGDRSRRRGPRCPGCRCAARVGSRCTPVRSARRDGRSPAVARGSVDQQATAPCRARRPSATRATSRRSNVPSHELSEALAHPGVPPAVDRPVAVQPR